MRRLDTTEMAEAIQIEIFRAMGAKGRLQAATDLARTSRNLLAAGVRKRHPAYDDEQVRYAVIRLTLGEEWFLKVYPHARDLVP